MKTIELEQLAVMFRTNDRNLGHCSVLEQMTEAGLAYSYGLFRAIPRHHNKKRLDMANAIASALDRKAKEINL